MSATSNDTLMMQLTPLWRMFNSTLLEQLLIELAPTIGIRGGRLQALLYMMKQTAPGDWTNPAREPVFFAPQDQTAEALCKTRRALYDDEAALGLRL